jgi:tetratricopeptide (TPR) repeat protein
LAKTLIEQGDYATAQAHLERALQIVEAQFPPEHVDVLRTLSSIATLNRRRGEHQLARQQFAEVLARFERSVGVKHPFATQALLGMGETLKAAGEPERAETFYRAALDNQRGPYAERRVIMAECLEGYADLVRRRGRQGEAAAIAAHAAKVRAYLHAELLKTNRV